MRVSFFFFFLKRHTSIRKFAGASDPLDTATAGSMYNQGCDVPINFRENSWLFSLLFLATCLATICSPACSLLPSFGYYINIKGGVIGCRNLRTAYSRHPAETIVVLKVTTLLLLRISLKPSSYGKVNDAAVCRTLILLSQQKGGRSKASNACRKVKRGQKLKEKISGSGVRRSNKRKYDGLGDRLNLF